MPHKCKVRGFLETNSERYKAKESHPGKPLLKHVEEVASWFDKLADFYGIHDSSLIELGHYLSYYHDLGKLQQCWDVNAEERVPHSPSSVEVLFREHVSIDLKGATGTSIMILPLYFIWKHHGSLTRRIASTGQAASKFPPLKLIEAFGNLEKIVEPDKAVDYVDVFGMFKIADAISAMSRLSNDSQAFDRVVESPAISEDNVRRSLVAEGKEFDKSRWNKQRGIMGLPNVGMLRAPTGWGKTSVAPLFVVGKPCTRLFFLLPTITAIKKFHDTLSSSFCNVGVYFYFYDVESYRHENGDESERKREIFLARSLQSPITITTVDQFLLTFLQVGKYHSKRFAFRGSTVILDEIHLLNPIMLRLVTFIMNRYLQRYKMRLLLMSATFPEAYAEYLTSELGLQENHMLDLSGEYSNLRRVLFRIENKDIMQDAERLLGAAEEGKVLVIVNTVDKAVRLGRKLKSMCDGIQQKERIAVFHARLMYKHRKEREDDIISGKLKDKRHILVATQVCEVSLDISYDFLFTELAPLGSIIQRFGRVNRPPKSRKVERVNALVYIPAEATPDNEWYPYLYDEMVSSREVLRSLEGSLENEKQLLDHFDEWFKAEDLRELVEREGGKLNLDAWEGTLSYLYSFDVGEDRLKRILDYRDGFTTLAIPHPDAVDHPETACELSRLMREMEAGSAGLNSHTAAKRMTVPVPYSWLRSSRIEDLFGFPVFDPKDKTYTREFGFVRREDI